MLKGQSPSQESLIQGNITRHNTLLSLMKWEVAEPYLDIPIVTGKNNQYTIRQYKDAIISGIQQDELRNSGISKHVLQFLSNFCQGKVTITPEQLYEEYKSGLSLEQIAIKYNLPLGDMTYLRKLYQIKRRGSAYIKRKQEEIPLTQRQKEIVYGSLMGDAKKTSGSSVGFGHSSKQREYLMWKFNEMYSVASKNSLKLYVENDPRTDTIVEGWRFYTHANSDIEIIVSQFYTPTKEVSQEILNNLTALSVAVWLEDDGKTDFSKKNT